MQQIDAVAAYLHLIDEAKSIWDFTEDPGPGIYGFGDFAFEVRAREAFGKVPAHRAYFVYSKDGEVLTMALRWEPLLEMMKDRTLSQGQMNARGHYKKIEHEEEDYMKHSKEENIRRIKFKCKNDAGLQITDDQAEMCLIEMEETGLSLFHNQLWPNKRTINKKVELPNGRYDWKKVERICWDPTIDGLRAQAAKTGLFAGVTAPEFKECKNENGNEDISASVTVFRRDHDSHELFEFTGFVYMSEFVQLVDEYDDGRKTGRKVPNHTWSSSPKNQLGIAAERQALRKAFPHVEKYDDLSVSGPPRDLEPRPEPKSMSRDEDSGYESDSSPEPSERKSKSKKRNRQSENRPAPEPAQASSPPADVDSTPEPEVSSGPEGKFVGIPKSGFGQYIKYNKDEMIVMLASNPQGTHKILALDSGQRVTVSNEGYEVDRRPRKDENPGGRRWKEGEPYYDGSKVLKCVVGKKDPLMVQLSLDSGAKVRLDRWGKEVYRKQADPSPTPEEPAAPPAPQSGPPKSAKPQEAVAPVIDTEADIESIEDVSMLRKLTEPLLRKWGKQVRGAQLSPKDAFRELVGVDLKKNEKLTADDYKALYHELKSALEQ